VLVGHVTLHIFLSIRVMDKIQLVFILLMYGQSQRVNKIGSESKYINDFCIWQSILC